MMLRAHWARAQLRARYFGARQWIQNKKLHLFYIYNVFVSSKLPEMKAFERISISVNFHENKFFENFENQKLQNLKIFILH